MSQSPPGTLEVHVSFEANRLAPVYLSDAYELLIPIVREPKPAAAEWTRPAPLPKSTPEKKAV